MEFEYISFQFYAYKRDFLRFICVQFDSSPSVRVDSIQSLSFSSQFYYVGNHFPTYKKFFCALYAYTLLSPRFFRSVHLSEWNPIDARVDVFHRHIVHVR